MEQNKKGVVAIVALVLIAAGLYGAMLAVGNNNSGGNNAVLHEVDIPYGDSVHVVEVGYSGLDMMKLDDIGRVLSGETAGSAPFSAGGSITFASYSDGTVGSVRNLDIQSSDECIYEFIIEPGLNAKNTVWGISHPGIDDRAFGDLKDKGLSDSMYYSIPFYASDAVSFGYTINGQKVSLYASSLMRCAQTDSEGHCIWGCTGTYPDAKIRTCAQCVPVLLTAQCLSVSEALAYVGAVDESYSRITPDVEPSLNVFTLSMDGAANGHWFNAIPLSDSTGRYGVLEFMDNKAVWHESKKYSFDFFLQDEYLHNSDSSYKEQYGMGIGRMNATVPYLNSVANVSDHISLMNSIRYSYKTYYNEDTHVSCDPSGTPVDWRSELAGYDVWATYGYYKGLGLDTSAADAAYPLYAYYHKTSTDSVVRIDSYADYSAQRSDLAAIYDMNYVLDNGHGAEIRNVLNWSGAFFKTLNAEQAKQTQYAWKSVCTVAVDPQNFTVYRYFCEDPTLIGKITWDDVDGMVEHPSADTFWSQLLSRVKFW